MTLPPLVFRPIYKEKVWGGRALTELGRTLPGADDTSIGESWEIADLAVTSPTGGGGAAAHSVVAGGPLAGMGLRALMETRRDELLGPGAACDAFPLLVKYLDARRPLSVQVHPSAAYAETHPEARPKSEAWYVVRADPGAVIYKGLVPGTTRAQLARAVEEGRVPELLVAVPATPGDVHYLPSGICHALGRGILVAEVQTPSDTTFRLYDWGRTDRVLHIDEALDAVLLDPDEAAGQPSGDGAAEETPGGRALVRCEHFAIDEWVSQEGGERTVDPEGAEVWMVLEGAIDVDGEGGDAVSVRSGVTALLPASLASVRLRMAEGTRALRVTLP